MDGWMNRKGRERGTSKSIPYLSLDENQYIGFSSWWLAFVRASSCWCS